MIKKRLWPGLR